MMHSKRLSSLRVKSTLLFLIIVGISSCRQESEEIDFVARVNETYLTREDFASLVDTSKIMPSEKNEIIKEWINREVLYQKALDLELTDSEEFERIIQNSRKELAGAFLMKEILKKEPIEISDSDVLEYYQNKSDEFRIKEDAFVINRMDFLDEETAIKFRNLAVESDWQKGTTFFNDNPAVAKQIKNKLFYEFEIHPSTIVQLLKELYTSEISIVISGKPGYYSVVQLVYRVKKNTIPEFELIKYQVKQRFHSVKRQQVIDKFIKEVYSESDIEIKN